MLDIQIVGSVPDTKDLKLPPAEEQVEAQQRVDVLEEIDVHEHFMNGVDEDVFCCRRYFCSSDGVAHEKQGCGAVIFLCCRVGTFSRKHALHA